jgi:hypothetical protein
MNATTRIKAYLPALAVGLLFFAIHFLLIFHHVYVDASQKGARISPGRHLEFPRPWHNWLDLNRWDAGHYENIIVNGYRNAAQPHTPRPTIQWYPGYPLLAKSLCAITGAKPTLVFSGLSVVFTLAFWLVLWSPGMTAHFGRKTILLVSLLILCWPGSFIWFAGMTEPLVALLLVLILYLWVTRRPAWIFPVLGLATFTKQPFVPAALVIILLDRLANGRKILASLSLLLISVSGFIAFGAYTFFCFGDFFASSTMASKAFGILVNPFSLVDLANYARHIDTLNGAVAAATVLFLLAWGLKLVAPKQTGPFLKALFFRNPAPVSTELFLWSVALAYTAFVVLGSAYNQTLPFMSMLRYQSVNVCLFFLLAILLRPVAGWKLMLMMVPLVWIGLYWQNVLTVNYWLWKWVT